PNRRAASVSDSASYHHNSFTLPSPSEVPRAGQPHPAPRRRLPPLLSRALEGRTQKLIASLYISICVLFFCCRRTTRQICCNLLCVKVDLVHMLNL
uniref:Uncharacterized protein n=1 Tax=Aegilops tauschii subsp. strangulata TaxID=200361 RepID=A0A453JXQ7_AEGTS